MTTAAHPFLCRAGIVGSDLFTVTALVFCIPFVVLGIGVPIALFLQALLWVGRSL